MIYIKLTNNTNCGVISHWYNTCSAFSLAQVLSTSGRVDGSGKSILLWGLIPESPGVFGILRNVIGWLRSYPWEIVNMKYSNGRDLPHSSLSSEAVSSSFKWIVQHPQRLLLRVTSHYYKWFSKQLESFSVVSGSKFLWEICCNVVLVMNS